MAKELALAIQIDSKLEEQIDMDLVITSIDGDQNEMSQLKRSK